MKRQLFLIAITLAFTAACMNEVVEESDIDVEGTQLELTSGRYTTWGNVSEGSVNNGLRRFNTTASSIRSLDFMQCFLQYFQNSNWLCHQNDHLCRCITLGTCPSESGRLLEPRVLTGVGGFWEMSSLNGQTNTSMSRVRLTNEGGSPVVLRYKAEWRPSSTSSWRQQNSVCRINGPTSAELTISASRTISGPTF